MNAWCLNGGSDQRRVIFRTAVVLTIESVFPMIGLAYASNAHERYALGRKTEGLDVSKLNAGDVIVADVNRFGCVIRASMDAEGGDRAAQGEAP